MAVDTVARALALGAMGLPSDTYTKSETDSLLSAKSDLVNGTVPLSQIPPAAIERIVTVANDTARFALTTAEVQLGDTVKVTSTNKMYFVIDTDHLDGELGYQVYVAGKAAEAVADQNGDTIDTTYVKIVSGKQLSTEDYTAAEKAKLSGIEAEANKTIVDSALNLSSTNPVQNKAVKESLDNKVDKVTGKQLSTEDYTTAEKTKLARVTVGKNLIPTSISSPLTQGGITLTLNNDYSVSATGTATDATRVITGSCTLPAGHYRLSGCPYTGNPDYSMELYTYDSENDQWVLYDDSPVSIITGDDGTTYSFTIQNDMQFRVVLCFNQGCTVSDVTFRIMIKDDTVGDDTYEPYIPSNAELYSMIGNINTVLESVLGGGN